MDSNKGPIEIALSTDLRGAPYSFGLWDVHTGAQLVTFKGNKSCPIRNCLQLIDSNYFVTASDNILQVWSIYNRKCQDQKLFLPGRPSTLCVSPCTNYIAVGISEMIYIWQIKSGNLLAHSQRHYQTLTTLKFNQDGTFLFSGAEDGMVLVWPFADVISGTHHTGALHRSHSKGVSEPRYTWQHHSAMITDIHICNSGLCITSSIDKSINIYNYLDGKRLHSIIDWPTPLWSLAMNKNATRLFLGGQDGNIYEMATSSLGLSHIMSRKPDADGQKKPFLTGHKDRVDHLMLSLDGSLLISGSHDSTCKIWCISTGRMLRDVKHQAALSNLVSLIVPDAFSLTSMTQRQVKPSFSVRPFKREVHKAQRDTSVDVNEMFEESATVIVNIKNSIDLFSRQEYQHATRMGILSKRSLEHTSADDGKSPCDNKAGEGIPDRAKIKNLKNRLRELYMIAAEKIFTDAAGQSLKTYADIVNDVGEIDEDKPPEIDEEKPPEIEINSPTHSKLTNGTHTIEQVHEELNHGTENHFAELPEPTAESFPAKLLDEKEEPGVIFIDDDSQEQDESRSKRKEMTDIDASNEIPTDDLPPQNGVKKFKEIYDLFVD